MRPAVFAACFFLAAALTWEPNGHAAKTEALSGPVLLLPGGKEPCRLRLDIVIDGKAPAAAWNAFLDRLFDHFDADGDGSLSRTETARLMPLPLPGGKELTFDFARLDTDKNGKGSRAELKAYCRANGFTPVVVVVPPSADDLRLADLFLRRLDANGDGELTRAELRRAPQSLRKYDLNDDEYLDLTELLAGAEGVRRPTETRLTASGRADEKDVVLRLDLGATAQAISERNSDDTIKLVPAPAQRGLYRLHGSESWLMTIRAVRSGADVRSARDFITAWFKTALGGAATLARADLEEDAALAGLLELLPYADRNGDNRLSLGELQAYLDLMELGLRAQVWVTATDRDRNPFHVLDSDGDGRLSYREQGSVSDLLRGKATVKGLPAQFDLSFGGPAVSSWGGVALLAVKRPRAAPANASAAPRWFRAMDRNGDGVLSPREFVGPPAAFRKLDLDGDGVISPAEAARATNR